MIVQEMVRPILVRKRYRWTYMIGHIKRKIDHKEVVSKERRALASWLLAGCLTCHGNYGRGERAR